MPRSGSLGGNKTCSLIGAGMSMLRLRASLVLVGGRRHQSLKRVTGSFIQGSPGQIISAILTGDETRLGPGQSRFAGAHAGRVSALFCARPPQPAREGD